MSTERYICIHGHFYQPPRENPWLEAIEVQDSAYPHHDWNERITDECYGPNATSRILDGEGCITRIVNNYSRISFNFGPTLLAWMEAKAPEVYEAILRADRQSQKRFSGHGSAIAQVYNHMIMPLANTRDKYSQVRWGIADFEYRFGRMPEGMWLAETAVDLETLEILAELGIKYTILSPYQAKRVRELGSEKWEEVSGGHVDPKTPYEQKLPSGKTIVVFFYDGPISQGIAFERLLFRGEDFAHRLMGAFSENPKNPQLVHIATDGETYGHHHAHGDMALAYALHYIEQNESVHLTNYGEYLEKHPNLPECEILENTAWSCAHGVERWRSDCSCCTGGRMDWNQSWRGPLRDALDWLRDTLEKPYEVEIKKYLTDPWAARDAAISLILNRSPENVAAFLAAHQKQTLTPEERVRVLQLLELQRHLMLMYTSCGWFFDEISGIETVQVIQYAGHAVQLAQGLFGIDDLEETFLAHLALAKSNVPEVGDGREIYLASVIPSKIGLRKVAAHFSASSLFENYENETEVYCYHVSQKDAQILEGGTAKLAIGSCQVTSKITTESALLEYVCLHLGDHNLTGGVRLSTNADNYAELKEKFTKAINKSDVPKIIRLIPDYFPESNFSLETLFRDEQRKIVDLLMDSAVSQMEEAYRQVYKQYLPLSRFLSDLGTPVPSVFRTTADVVLNTDLRRALSQRHLVPTKIRSLLEQAEVSQITLDIAGLSYTLQHVIEELAGELSGTMEEPEVLEQLKTALTVAKTMPFAVDLTHVQNRCYRLLKQLKSQELEITPPEVPLWAESIKDLCEQLRIRITLPV